jgi:hypothetical protein
MGRQDGLLRFRAAGVGIIEDQQCGGEPSVLVDLKVPTSFLSRGKALATICATIVFLCEAYRKGSSIATAQPVVYW